MGVLYFDYTANICTVYVDPGDARFLSWIMLHAPLMLSMIILGVAVSQELSLFHDALLARVLLPRAAYLALLGISCLDFLMVGRTHRKSRISRSIRVLVRLILGIPL